MKFDKEKYSIETQHLQPRPKQVVQKPTRNRPLKKFLKGPIPWQWLSKAANLPGKALHVGIVLWFLSGLKRSSVVPLSQKVLRSFGVKRNAAYRGLKALEEAGLVNVNRQRGRSSLVTILRMEE